MRRFSDSNRLNKGNFETGYEKKRVSGLERDRIEYLEIGVFTNWTASAGSCFPNIVDVSFVCKRFQWAFGKTKTPNADRNSGGNIIYYSHCSHMPVKIHTPRLKTAKSEFASNSKYMLVEKMVLKSGRVCSR